MAMDSVVDERTMREIYLTGFEMAVKEGHAQSIMSAYNMVNGTYANENHHLLSDILRDEWGFDGYVVTDWGADNDHTEGVKAGCNLVMPAPGPDCAIGLLEDLAAGKIDEATIDQRVSELLKVVFETHEAVAKAEKSFDVEAHHAIARKCAEESIVLLDNDGILPLAGGDSVAIIGEFAKDPRYQGAGSSQVNPTKMDNLYDNLAGRLNITGYAKGYDRKNPHPVKKLVDEAVEVARNADKVLLCVGLEEILESEGMDRLHMDLSDSMKTLINEVCAVNSNVILVLYGGAPFVMPERSIYRAAIHGYLGGQAGAGAMADAILGVVNPSGKLNETWPHKLEDNSSYNYFPSKELTAEYREGLFVGYRYYDSIDMSVRYPFGYGLSYTTFEYSDLAINGNDVSFTITNTGSRDGSEVAELYVACKNSNISRPKKELKGFKKVALKAGESKKVTITLDDKAFRYFDVQSNAWEIEEADYEICVAASVSDVKLSETIHVAGKTASSPAPECYRTGNVANVSDEDFETILGRPIPDGHWSGELKENDAICQLYYAKSGLARLLYKVLTNMKNKSEAKGTPDLNILFIYNMPFRAIGKMAGGMFSRKMVDDVLFIVNGHFFRGFGRVIRDFFRNLKANKKFEKAIKPTK
jgi:beta-glucosidase